MCPGRRCGDGTPGGYKHGRASAFCRGLSTRVRIITLMLISNSARHRHLSKCRARFPDIQKSGSASSKTQADHIRTNPDDMMGPAAGSYSRTHHPTARSSGLVAQIKLARTLSLGAFGGLVQGPCAAWARRGFDGA